MRRIPGTLATGVGERHVVYTTFSLADTGNSALADPAYAKAASMGR